MKRRRPSALYSVLDEEQLLAGVDLADYPDPLAGRVANDPDHDDTVEAWPVPGAGDGAGEEWPHGGRDDWGDWSPDPEADQADRVDEPARSAAAGSFGRGRGRWLTVGFAAALVLVLLVAHGLGSALETSVGQSAARSSVTRQDALSAVSGSSVGAVGQRSVPHAASRAPRAAGAPSGPGRSPRRRSPVARHTALGQAAGPSRSATMTGPRVPLRSTARSTPPRSNGSRPPAGGSSSSVQSRSDSVRPAPPVGERRSGRAGGSPPARRSLSPDQEFGFER